MKQVPLSSLLHLARQSQLVGKYDIESLFDTISFSAHLDTNKQIDTIDLYVGEHWLAAIYFRLDLNTYLILMISRGVNPGPTSGRGKALNGTAF